MRIAIEWYGIFKYLILFVMACYVWVIKVSFVNFRSEMLILFE